MSSKTPARYGSTRGGIGACRNYLQLPRAGQDEESLSARGGGQNARPPPKKTQGAGAKRAQPKKKIAPRFPLLGREVLRF